MFGLTDRDLFQEYCRDRSGPAIDYLLARKDDDSSDVGLAKAVARDSIAESQRMGFTRKDAVIRSKRTIDRALNLMQSCEIASSHALAATLEKDAQASESTEDDTHEQAPADATAMINLSLHCDQIIDALLMKASDQEFPKDKTELFNAVKSAVPDASRHVALSDNLIEQFLWSKQFGCPKFFKYCGTKWSGSFDPKKIDRPSGFREPKNKQVRWSYVIDALLIGMNVRGEIPSTHGVLEKLIGDLFMMPGEQDPPYRNAITGDDGYFRRLPKFLAATKFRKITKA